MNSSFLTPSDMNYYLRQYLATRHEPTKLQALDHAARLLINPSQILESPVLAPDHPLKLQALVVSDAFEAVTNGMENPEALDQLEAIPSGALFSHWKPLIFGIKALYQENLKESLTYWSQIPQESPLHALLPLLKALSGQDQKLNSKEREFALALVDRSNLTTSILEQVQEALITGMEEIFLSLLPLALSAPVKESTQAAGKLSLWALSQVEKYDLDYPELFSILKEFWGVSEGTRLISLGIFPLDPEASLLMWMNFIQEIPVDEPRFTHSLEIFKDMTLAVKDFQNSQGLGDGFFQDFDLVFSQTKTRRPKIEKYFTHQGWEEFYAPQGSTTPGVPKQRLQEKLPIQFDLFAF